MEVAYQPHPGTRIRYDRCSLPGLTGLATVRREGADTATIDSTTSGGDANGFSGGLTDAAVGPTPPLPVYCLGNRTVGALDRSVERNGLMSIPPRRKNRASTVSSVASVAPCKSTKIRSMATS